MKITYDPIKRDQTLANRNLDMARAGEVFDGVTLTVEDDRQDYGEQRYITVERLDDRVIAIVWTPRGLARRIVSMRKANDREQKAYGPRLDRSR